MYPSSAGSHGQDSFERAVNEFQPHLVISLGEIWMTQWIHTHSTRKGFKWISYVPVDAGPLYPPWESVLMGMDEIVCMSEFGRSVLKTGIPSKRSHLIYHGVDTEVFQPLPNRSDIKGHPRFQGKFVVGCVARNQPRKNIPALVKAFALLAAKYDDIHLYLHMNPCDVGHDIVTLFRRYGLEGKADVCSPDFSLDRAIPDPHLNQIYNLFDISALPSNAEGFGLPIIESLSAGVPVVATDYSACSELVRGRGELARILTTITTGTNVVEHAVIDPDDLACCIEKLYLDPGLVETYGTAGREFARTLTWDSLIPKWLEVISLTLGVDVSFVSRAEWS
ncbi:MAG: glycosyltransferase family 4 protein [Verrucomicrobiales bacterium]|nr:glycosyltransferase family 4 protein [Verrucomicrobiales bacterium]